MSTKRKLAHNTVIQLIGKIISTGLGLIAIGMLTRYLGVEQFGWYATTLAFLQFISVLIDFGLIPVTSQMMSEVPHELKNESEAALSTYRNKLMNNLLGFRFVTASIGLGIAPLIALLFPYPNEVKIAIAFTTINMLSVSMNQIFTGYYQAKLIIHLQVIGEVIGRIALIIGLYLCVRYDAGFLPTMWAITISSVCYTIFMWLAAARHTTIAFNFDWSVWKKITIKMWPLAISIMFNVIYLRGDVILLSLFRDQIEVGFYGAAYRVIDIIALTAMMIMGLMLPLLSYAWSINDNKKFKEHFQLAFNIMMMFAVPMTIGLAILSKPIVRTIAGEDFIAAALPLTLLSFAVFGLFIGAIFGHLAVAIDRQKETIPVYFINAIITLALYLICIPRFGMNGAAAVSVISELFAGVYLYVVIKKYAHLPLTFNVFGKILLGGLIMAICLYLLRNHLILSILVGSTVYGVALIATRAISLTTLKEITSLKKA